MKSSHRLIATLALVVAAPFVLAAEPAPAAPGTAPAPKEKKIETDLSHRMDKMAGAFRKLRRQAADATKNEDSLAQVAILRECGEASLKLEPYKAGEVPAADRARLVAGYQDKMKEFNAAVAQLEAAFKAGQNEAAAKLVQDLSALQKAGHKEYKSKAID
jgi:hypothetical protein